MGSSLTGVLPRRSVQHQTKLRWKAQCFTSSHTSIYPQNLSTPVHIHTLRPSPHQPATPIRPVSIPYNYTPELKLRMGVNSTPIFLLELEWVGACCRNRVLECRPMMKYNHIKRSFLNHPFSSNRSLFSPRTLQMLYSCVPSRQHSN